MVYAHSPNSEGHPHDLVEHLQSVAKLAAEFAGKFGAADFGYWAGLWHDLGKFNPDFQTYLANPTVRRGPDHSSAGSILAETRFEPLAFLVAGHHSGLPSLTGLKQRLREKRKVSSINQALENARQVVSTIEPQSPLTLELPPFLKENGQKIEDTKRRLELFLRMVFSALVDADFLDTERHFDPKRSQQRVAFLGLEQLWQKFEMTQATFSGQQSGLLNESRHEIYKASVQNASLSPGFYSLTVPTGGGKTRSSMAFAIKHALIHGLDRIIVAIPYTSIIEQTADVYRNIFGNESVLEHHSAIEIKDDPSDPLSYHDVWTRLASENWDAPIVVTTTVRLFESLFANKPSTCRKLHNIARSILILDEVQTLPPELLTPMLDVLQELVDHYKVSIVLCTATQPALQNSPYLKGLKDVREIVPNPAYYFDSLKRVQYALPMRQERWNWERVATEMQTTNQSLVIVNTKNDALRLLDVLVLKDSEAFHLSTLLCGAHRHDVLQEVRRRLHSNEPCHLISTQVVEAGVDLDFPLVLRAIGPLDRIVQAAGRCNREGRLETGRVVIFWPEDGALPSGAYRTGTDEARSLLNHPQSDLHDPALYRIYFERLYQDLSLDAKNIQGLRQALDYPEVARRFRLIDDDTETVVVHYKSRNGKGKRIESLLNLIRERSEIPRWAMRRLQPYLVNVRTRLISEYYREGFLHEIMPGLWEWLGGYDDLRGLVAINRDPADLVL